MRADERDAWREADDCLRDLLELPPSERRRALTVRSCDPRVVRRVEALLAALDRDDGPLDTEPDWAAFARGGPPSDSPPPPVALSGRLFGAYRLGEEIGRGGMSVVYRGQRDDGLYAAEVAIKILGTGLLSTSAAERFRRERHLLARLRHPHIAMLLDGGTTEDGTPYLVLELIHGRPIDRYCEEEHLDPRARIALMLQVCAAVAFAHRNLVVHRDLKPGNLLVDSSGAVKLLDFGIAKLLEPETADPSLTQVHGRFLTPDYAAPEQFDGGAITTSTDVFALGRVLERLLPATARPAGSDLANILARAGSASPGERYPDARALAADLENWLAGRVVQASPPSALDRLRKGLRRHRGKAAAAAAICLVAAAGGIATWLQAERARHEARNARAINAFLTDLFRASDPDTAKGDDPPASELFRRGAVKARADYRAEPLLQADLLFEIGRIQKERGQYEDAASSLADALRLRRERFGPDSAAVAEVEVEIAQLRYHQGSLSDAIAMLRTAVATFERNSPNDPMTLPEAEVSLAEMLMVDGQFAASRDLCERVLARFEAGDPQHEALRAGALETLGAALQGLGELDAAAAATEAAVASERRRSPDGSTDLAIFLSDLGFVRLDLGDFAGAEAAFAESLALKRRLLGSAHVQVASALNNLAYALAYQGRGAEAVEKSSEAVRIARALFPAPHPDLAAALAAYGNALRSAGRIADAELAYGEALAVWQGIDEAERTGGFTSANAQYGAVLADLGRYREALSYLDTAIALYATEEGHGGPRLDAARARRGFVLARLGRAPEAIAELAPTLPALAETRFGWKTRDYLAWQIVFADALLEAGRPGEAARTVALVREHLAARDEKPGPQIEADLAAVAARLAALR